MKNAQKGIEGLMYASLADAEGDLMRVSENLSTEQNLKKSSWPSPHTIIQQRTSTGIKQKPIMYPSARTIAPSRVTNLTKLVGSNMSTKKSGSKDMKQKFTLFDENGTPLR